MVIYIHIVKNGRGINDEDGYRKFFLPLSSPAHFKLTPRTAETNTQMAFYAILEAGFTIITVNLPSLWYFTAGVTPERILRSVRSIVSLGSRGSGSHGGSANRSKTSVHQTVRDPATGRSLDTGSSRSNLTKLGDASTVETYAMTDMSGKREEMDTNGIRVERKFHRDEEQV